MKTPQRTPEKGTITLCGVQGCCPTVDFNDPNKIVLRDDHGGMVQLKPSEWADLKAKFAEQPAVQS